MPLLPQGALVHAPGVAPRALTAPPTACAPTVPSWRLLLASPSGVSRRCARPWPALACGHPRPREPECSAALSDLWLPVTVWCPLLGHHTALFRSAPRRPPSLPRPRPGMALQACRSHRALGPRSFPLGRALKSSGSTTIAPGRPSARGPGLLLPPPGLRSPGPGLLPRLAGATGPYIMLFQRSRQL